MSNTQQKQSMKAVGLYRYLPIDHPESLLDLEIEKPVPTGRDILVKVKAVSVNPVDVKVRAPKEKIEHVPHILGWDVAGVIEQTGANCELFQQGDEVYYAGNYIRPGGNSEFHLVDERIVGKKPSTLDFAQATALPLTTITAWEAIFDRLGISRKVEENDKKTILIIGAAGGVGSIATQIAKWIGLTVIGTASRPETVQWVKNFGADHVINHHEPFIPQLNQLGFGQVDYILNLNSTELYWIRMAEAIAPQGKICGIVDAEESVDLNLLKNKSVTFAWEMMFSRPMFQTDDMIEQHRLLNQISDLIDSGILRTTLAKRLEPINEKICVSLTLSLNREAQLGKLYWNVSMQEQGQFHKIAFNLSFRKVDFLI